MGYDVALKNLEETRVKMQSCFFYDLVASTFEIWISLALTFKQPACSDRF